MVTFANLCISSGALRRLRFFSLTIFRIYPKIWMTHVVHLLSNSPLEIFYIYSNGLSFDSPVEDEFWTMIILTHGKRLLEFSVETLISWEVIHSICVQCTKLEHLSVVVDPDNVVRTLAPVLLEELIF
jgi:hypothetical protein